MNDKLNSVGSNSLPYFGFGIAGLGTGLVIQAPALLLLIYMTDTLAIPAAMAGFAMFIPRIFDVITDPIMGMISDRTKSRWGRRRPYLFVGGLITGIALIFLFMTPLYDSVNARLIYVIVLFIIMQTGVTIFMVPYYSMPAEMTDDAHEHTKLMSYRAFFSLVSALIGGALAPWLVLTGGGGQEGYANMSLIIGLITGSAMIASFYGTRHVHFIERDKITPPLKVQMQIVFKSRPFVIFVLSFLLYVTALGCFIASVPYFSRYVIKVPELLPKIWLYIQISAVLTVPFWTMFANHWEKHICFLLAVIVMAMSSSGFMLIEQNNFSLFVFYILCVIFGVGLSGTQVSCWAMLPDVIRWDTLCHNMNRGGIFSGFMLAFEKMGFAFGSLLAGTILGVMGYVESLDSALIQSESAVQGIRLATGAAGAALLFLSAVIMYFYPLSHGMLKEKS